MGGTGVSSDKSDGLLLALALVPALVLLALELAAMGGRGVGGTGVAKASAFSSDKSEDCTLVAGVGPPVRDLFGSMLARDILSSSAVVLVCCLSDQRLLRLLFDPSLFKLTCMVAELLVWLELWL